MNLFKNIVFIISFAISGTFSFAESSSVKTCTAGEQMVYVCTKSSAAYAYHTHSDCQHIKRCHEEGHIDKMTISAAKKAGRTLCKTCAKRN